MARRKPGEVIEKFRTREAEPVVGPIASALQAWSQKQTVIDKLRVARPGMPSALGDRAADICEPLLAIADLAGGKWPDMARAALVELCAGGDVVDESAGIRLLAAIREIFQAGQVDRISTKDLLEELISRDGDEPWAAWWGSRGCKRQRARSGGETGPGFSSHLGSLLGRSVKRMTARQKAINWHRLKTLFSFSPSPLQVVATSRHNDKPA